MSYLITIYFLVEFQVIYKETTNNDEKGFRWLSYRDEQSNTPAVHRKGKIFTPKDTNPDKFSIEELKQKWASYQNMLRKSNKSIAIN